MESENSYMRKVIKIKRMLNVSSYYTIFFARLVFENFRERFNKIYDAETMFHAIEIKAIDAFDTFIFAVI